VFILAQRPEAPLKCCTDRPEELEAALGAFERANAVVLDSDRDRDPVHARTAQPAADLAAQFVISQSTLAELRRLAFEDTLLACRPDFSASIVGNATTASAPTSS